MTVRDTARLLVPEVQTTLGGLTLRDADAGVVRLAVLYAAEIDAAPDGKAHAWAVRWIGPLLLDCLDSLGATPAARARINDGTMTPQSSKTRQSRLKVLRDASSSGRAG